MQHFVCCTAKEAVARRARVRTCLARSVCTRTREMRDLQCYLAWTFAARLRFCSISSLPLRKVEIMSRRTFLSFSVLHCKIWFTLLHACKAGKYSLCTHDYLVQNNSHLLMLYTNIICIPFWWCAFFICQAIHVLHFSSYTFAGSNTCRPVRSYTFSNLLFVIHTLWV